jgi:hypothetical protein
MLKYIEKYIGGKLRLSKTMIFGAIVGIVVLLKLVGIGRLYDVLQERLGNDSLFHMLVAFALILGFVFWRYVKKAIRLIMLLAIWVGIVFILNNSPVSFYLDDFKDGYLLDNLLPSEQTDKPSIQPIDTPNNDLMHSHCKQREYNLIQSNNSIRTIANDSIKVLLQIIETLQENALNTHKADVEPLTNSKFKWTLSN